MNIGNLIVNADLFDDVRNRFIVNKLLAQKELKLLNFSKSAQYADRCELVIESALFCSDVSDGEKIPEYKLEIVESAPDVLYRIVPMDSEDSTDAPTRVLFSDTKLSEIDERIENAENNTAFHVINKVKERLMNTDGNCNLIAIINTESGSEILSTDIDSALAAHLCDIASDAFDKID